MAGQSTATTLEKQATKLEQLWLELHSKRPEVLYHYTDAQGLLGMLNSHKLWATNRRFMNDPTEAEYAANTIRNVVENHRDQYETGLFEKVKAGVELILKLYLEQDEHYLACFCENGDLLSQWRGYGSVGGGYAMGFVADSLGLILYQSPDKPEPVLRKVLYKTKQQTELTGQWVKFIFDWESFRRRAAPKKDIDIEINDFGWTALNWFISQSVRCFKHPAYEEEQEWRVIQIGTTPEGARAVEPEFRASRRGVVEYVKLDLPTNEKKLPLKVICYGPTLDPTVTDRSLRLLCRGKGYDHVEINKSIVPFAG
ncbi:MAG TPA: DUF2971 domain-containing protein [Verrucomicrobiae bacterium]|nr:DUF2971 domain-containing protein [Verrucomicrobiae bacterium]